MTMLEPEFPLRQNVAPELKTYRKPLRNYWQETPTVNLYVPGYSEDEFGTDFAAFLTGPPKTIQMFSSEGWADTYPITCRRVLGTSLLRVEVWSPISSVDDTWVHEFHGYTLFTFMDKDYPTDGTDTMWSIRGSTTWYKETFLTGRTDFGKIEDVFEVDLNDV